MDLIIYTIFTFIAVYLISYFMLVRKADKYNRKRVPIEVEYLIKKYNIDVSKLKYKKFLNQISLVGSVDMTLTVLCIFYINNIIIQMLVGFVILLPIIYISFMLYGKYLIKKGYVKNGYKKNRK